MHGHGKLIYENDEFYEGDFVRGNIGFITRSEEDSGLNHLFFTQVNVTVRVSMNTLMGQHLKVRMAAESVTTIFRAVCCCHLHFR